MQYRVVGKIGDIQAWRRAFPTVTFGDIDAVLNGREFTRWYNRNRRVIEGALFAAVPALTAVLFGIKPTLFYELVYGSAVEAGAFGFLNGDGQILLWMIGIGIMSAIVTAFLKFTGRGDLVPLFMGASGLVLLLQFIHLFTSIYKAVSVFFSM